MRCVCERDRFISKFLATYPPLDEQGESVRRLVDDVVAGIVADMDVPCERVPRLRKDALECVRKSYAKLQWEAYTRKADVN